MTPKPRTAYVCECACECECDYDFVSKLGVTHALCKSKIVRENFVDYQKQRGNIIYIKDNYLNGI